MTGAGASLQGLTVYVTRPEPEATVLAGKISCLDAQAVVMPVMLIEPVSGASQQFERCVAQQDGGILVFVSRNAARAALDALTPERIEQLNRFKIAAIGSATAQTLHEYSLVVDLVPESSVFTSEALLSLPEMQAVKNEKITIVRGLGGRALLADRLMQRGATVRFCELYKRVLPGRFDPDNFRHCGKSGTVIIASSQEILENLLQLAGTGYEAIVKCTSLLVVSPRIQDAALNLGFKSDILVADNATDKAVIECLLKWHAAQEK